MESACHTLGASFAVSQWTACYQCCFSGQASRTRRKCKQHGHVQLPELSKDLSGGFSRELQAPQEYFSLACVAIKKKN